MNKVHVTFCQEESVKVSGEVLPCSDQTPGQFLMRRDHIRESHEHAELTLFMYLSELSFAQIKADGSNGNQRDVLLTGQRNTCNHGTDFNGSHPPVHQRRIKGIDHLF